MSIKNQLVSTKNQNLKKEPSGMKKIMGIMGQEFNTTDPLQLCKQLLLYMNEYADSLQLQREGTEEIKTEVQEPKKILKVEIAKKELETNTNSEIIYPSRKTRWVKNITHQEQRQKFQQQKFIALSFIEYGSNYHFITQVYPDMLPKTYRCYVEAINNQAVNEIVDFLRYECNLEIERLNRDQKRSIRTQLTKVREWLGNRDIAQLQTFYKFIKRHYDKSVLITEADALTLYGTILSIIRSPYVNVLDAQEGGNKRGEYTNGESLTPDEEKALIISYIKWKDLDKVTDLMCQKYGYQMKWSFRSVKNNLKLLLNASINKLIRNFKKEEEDIYGNFFTEKNRTLLHESQDIDIKIKLYSYYLERRIKYIKVKDLLQKLREFFEIYGKENSETSLPKFERTEDLVKKEEGSVFELTQSILKAEFKKQEPQTSHEEDEIKQEEQIQQ